jgi:hypothetical protein
MANLWTIRDDIAPLWSPVSVKDVICDGGGGENVRDEGAAMNLGKARRH